MQVIFIYIIQYFSTIILIVIAQISKLKKNENLFFLFLSFHIFCALPTSNYKRHQ